MQSLGESFLHSFSQGRFIILKLFSLNSLLTLHLFKEVIKRFANKNIFSTITN